MTTDSPEPGVIRRCSSCGLALPEDPSTPGRPHCLECGDTKRTFDVRTTLAANASVTATPAVLSYPKFLLTYARTLAADRHYGVAIVIAHMACEVAVERAMRGAFTMRGVPALARPALELLNGYNLGNDRTRSLYDALTEGDIAAQPFWSGFKASCERRNRIVHRGRLATAEEARESIDAVTALLKHLEAREPID